MHKYVIAKKKNCQVYVIKTKRNKSNAFRRNHFVIPDLNILME